MIYRAEVEAGVDLAQIDIDITDSEVKIIIPEIQVTDIYVDPDSIQFFDEKSALFNWSDKNDVVDAIKAAEKDVKKNANIEDLKAKEQTEVLIVGLLENAVGDRTVVISYK